MLNLETACPRGCWGGVRLRQSFGRQASGVSIVTTSPSMGSRQTPGEIYSPAWHRVAGVRKGEISPCGRNDKLNPSTSDAVKNKNTQSDEMEYKRAVSRITCRVLRDLSKRFSLRMQKLRTQEGLTMIEMIGVLAIIAVLAALIIPRVFDVIADSKVDALATAIRTYEIGVTKYYADVGSLLPLNVGGIPQAEGTGDSAVETSLASRLTLRSTDPLVLSTNRWPKFQGPYLEKFNSGFPPEIGTTMFLPTSVPVAINVPVTSGNIGWDLKGDDGNSDIPTGAYVAFFKLQGIGEEDFLKLDQLVDPLVGMTDAERKLRGRAKWDAANNGTLLLYMAHR